MIGFKMILFHFALTAKVEMTSETWVLIENE